MSQENEIKNVWGVKKIPKFPGCDDPGEVVIFLFKQFGNIFVDIGANRGFYTIRLAKNWKKLYAYEPFFSSAREIERLARINNLKNIIVRNKALSNKEGFQEFYLSPRGDKCHSLLPVGERTIKVPCSTLSKEFPKTKIDLIKVDTEGSEFQILEGAEKIIQNIKAWIIEVHDLKEICREFAIVKGKFEDRKKTMERYLQELGYRTLWIKDKIIYAWREKSEQS